MHASGWLAGGGWLPGGAPPPDHPAIADGPAECSALAAGSRCRLASVAGSGTPARISRAGHVQPSRGSVLEAPRSLLTLAAPSTVPKFPTIVDLWTPESP